MAQACLGSLLALLGAPASPAAQERTLSFYNTHTYEHLTIIYRRGNDYLQDALARINHILRDHRSGEEYPIDPQLLDYLYDLLEKIGYRGEVHIISGYRSPKTNTMLHDRSPGVAERSLHTRGRALDFRLPGINTKKVWETARSMKRGGSGYYRSSDFVQIDSGRVRSW
jgi:uncharacterized protein YcbK (DUF882 family)